MNPLDYTIANSNNIIVKTRIETIIYKMNKQDKPNKTLLNEFKDSLSRLNESYLWYNQTRERTLITDARNRDLESILMSQKVYIMDLESKIKELEKQNEQLKINIKIN
jgi:hypothetical protein